MGLRVENQTEPGICRALRAVAGFPLPGPPHPAPVETAEKNEDSSQISIDSNRNVLESTFRVFWCLFQF